MLKIDSRKIKQGDIFVALKGNTTDGHNYINQAIENGATTIVANYGKYPVKTIITQNTDEYIIDYLKKNYQNKINELTIIGVTGTNGKTTTCFLIYQILNQLGIKTSYIGTIGYYKNKFVKNLPNTTPNIVDLYELLLDSLNSNYTTIVMEVSSHALDLKRIEGLKFKVAAFTNLTLEHIDYHKTIENYLITKTKITNYANHIIVNKDDEHYCSFINIPHTTLGKTDANIKIKNIIQTKEGSIVEFSYKNKLYTINTKLKGEFNTYNILTAIFCCQKLELELENILKKISEITPPPGRCEIIQMGESQVIIDYAHTPDAVENILKTFKEENIITVIGCGGNRDKIKRPKMGELALKYSQKVIFTSDNPRNENPENIIADMINPNYNNYEIIVDRKEAIHTALKNKYKNTTILILGKGHETYQILTKKTIHFDDKEVVLNYINSK